MANKYLFRLAKRILNRYTAKHTSLLSKDHVAAIMAFAIRDSFVAGVVVSLILSTIFHLLFK